MGDELKSTESPVRTVATKLGVGMNQLIGLGLVVLNLGLCTALVYSSVDIEKLNWIGARIDTIVVAGLGSILGGSTLIKAARSLRK